MENYCMGNSYKPRQDGAAKLEGIVSLPIRDSYKVTMRQSKRPESDYSSVYSAMWIVMD